MKISCSCCLFKAEATCESFLSTLENFNWVECKSQIAEKLAKKERTEWQHMCNSFERPYHTNRLSTLTEFLVSESKHDFSSFFLFFFGVLDFFKVPATFFLSWISPAFSTWYRTGGCTTWRVARGCLLLLVEQRVPLTSSAFLPSSGELTTSRRKFSTSIEHRTIL